MWRDLILGTTDDAKCAAPATSDSLRDVTTALGQTLPQALSALLTECDGVRGSHSLDVVWNTERIIRDNLMFRTTPDFRTLYMPFEPLMFFGDNGGGDQFAFVRTPERDEIFVWDHETDSRFLATYSLQDYLRRALGEGGDWYRAD